MSRNIGRSLLSHLTDIRERYQSDVTKYLQRRGQAVDDLAITVPGGLFLCMVVALLNQRRDADRGPVHVLELGAGFSTLVLGRQARCALDSRDHDEAWIKFMSEFVTLQALGRRLEDDQVSAPEVCLHPGFPEILTHKHAQVTSLKKLICADPLLMTRQSDLGHRPAFRPGDIYQAIIFDQGPDLDGRAKSIAWAHRLLRPEGVLLFDDWRPKHAGRIQRALSSITRSTGRWHIGCCEETRRTPRDKAIGWATRDQSVATMVGDLGPQVAAVLGAQ